MKPIHEDKHYDYLVGMMEDVIRLRLQGRNEEDSDIDTTLAKNLPHNIAVVQRPNKCEKLQNMYLDFTNNSVILILLCILYSLRNYCPVLEILSLLLSPNTKGSLVGSFCLSECYTTTRYTDDMLRDDRT